MSLPACVSRQSMSLSQPKLESTVEMCQTEDIFAFKSRETVKKAPNDRSTALFPIMLFRKRETYVANVLHFTSRQGERDHSINNALHLNLF